MGIFESQHKIGDVVKFDPLINKKYHSATASSSAVPGKIVAVKFSESKVLYDIALQISDGDVQAFHEARPLISVDSIMVRNINS